MDSDIFFDDSEIDTREHEHRLMNNELKKREQVLWDKGYLDGLEWAETHYGTMTLEGEHMGQFQSGFQEGQDQALQKRRLFEEAGALNAYMLLTDSKPIQFSAEKQDIRAMMERLNIGIGGGVIDEKIFEDANALRERMNNALA